MHARSFRSISCVCCTLAVLLGGPVPAAGEAVTLDDLAGMVVEAESVRDQTVQLERGPTMVKVNQTWKLKVDPDRTVTFTTTSIGRTQRGTQKSAPTGGVFTLDEQRDVRNRGGGLAVWTFADGTLTFRRTFPAGAFRASFAFARGPEGLTCTVDSAYAREDGSGPIRAISPFGGREVTIVSAKQVSSDCRVTKANWSSGASQ
jgi:hypothetical protein